MVLNRGGPLSKMVSGTIGLAKEYSADKRERKGAQQASETSSHSSAVAHNSGNIQQNNQNDSSSEESDNEDWVLDLDEAQALQTSTNFQPQQTSDGNFNMDIMLDSFVHQHPPPAYKSNGISMNVLLPQRRPKSQHKGFVRAYAPVLQESGINQEAWLEFLDGFEKSISKNSWFNVTNGAIMVAGTAAALTMGISPVAHMASMAIHTSIELGRRGALNYQQNRYLDVMNDKFFKPRGLFCMVVKFHPSSDEILEETNIEQNITRSLQKRDGKNKWKGVISTSDMTFTNELEIPDPAPLVFPEIDKMTTQQKENSVKRFGHLMQDYMDRRASATTNAANPNSKLPVAPQKDFASVYGDPNSAANSGGFISLATGGKWNPGEPRGARHDMRREKLAARKERGKQRREQRPMSKMLKSDALYLMVTNLPSQEVLDRVGAEMDRASASS
jgi:hypothetical protein